MIRCIVLLSLLFQTLFSINFIKNWNQKSEKKLLIITDIPMNVIGTMVVVELLSCADFGIFDCQERWSVGEVDDGRRMFAFSHDNHVYNEKS